VTSNLSRDTGPQYCYSEIDGVLLVSFQFKQSERIHVLDLAKIQRENPSVVHDVWIDTNSEGYVTLGVEIYGEPRTPEPGQDDRTSFHQQHGVRDKRRRLT
jgi:hypothetical protein